ncbi:hypothetical protein RF11_06784 [Thelohanellus kitauei]|uniref:Uncharacterized protein n=1 Tax=Thelohanellus kitauei TaxID=669202 RepID=A0A0C2MVY2_THEKT|nr:hypothetical protein RF11_06784 [Thelohanellus kitauei]
MILIPTIVHASQSVKSCYTHVKYFGENSHYHVEELQWRAFYEMNLHQNVFLSPLYLLNNIYLWLRPKTLPITTYFPVRSDEIISKYVSFQEDRKNYLQGYFDEIYGESDDKK